ncbi:MAG: hypothetical protein Tsb0018_03310 [Opitutales bacterium]
MSNIDSSGLHHAHETSMVSAKQVSSADAESEAGSIAKNMGSVINSWSDKLNSALQSWNDINQEIQNDLNNAKFVVQEIKYAQSHYEWCVRSGVNLFIPASHYNDLMEAMSLLGIPASQRATGTLQTGGSKNGEYRMTQTDFATDRDLMLEYAKEDFSDFSGKISSLQQQETRIQLEVMYDFTGIQTNQKTLAGILSALKQMANAAINNIQ